MKPASERRCGFTVFETVLRLGMANNSEMADSSPEFFQRIDMPNGKTAWDWIQEWPALKKEVFVNYGAKEE